MEENDNNNCKQVKDTIKPKAWITIIILLTLLAVLTFIALAVGALGLRRSSITQLNKIILLLL